MYGQEGHPLIIGWLSAAGFTLGLHTKRAGLCGRTAKESAMSFWSSALSWGLKAAASSQAKQIEMQAIQQGLDKVSGLLKDKVPDYYAPVIEPLLGQIAAHATAAILSKQG